MQESNLLADEIVSYNFIEQCPKSIIFLLSCDCSILVFGLQTPSHTTRTRAINTDFAPWYLMYYYFHVDVFKFIIHRR